MKIYVINLDRDVERLSTFNRRCVELGVEYERVSAINGRNLREQECLDAINSFRWWCSQGRPVRIGEIGCAMSHYSIYRTMTEPVCVLEDDVILSEGFLTVLQSVENYINPSKPQVVLLSNHSKTRYKFSGIYRTRSSMYTEGYVITPVAAQSILRVNWPLQRPCDHWGVWAKRGIIELYHAIPTVCSQDQSQFVSGTVDAKSFKVSDLNFVQWIVHKIKRIIGKTLDNILPL